MLTQLVTNPHMGKILLVGGILIVILGLLFLDYIIKRIVKGTKWQGGMVHDERDWIDDALDYEEELRKQL